MWNDFISLLDNMGKKKQFDEQTLEEAFKKEITIIIKEEV